jgi:hypothetical protein
MLMDLTPFAALAACAVVIAVGLGAALAVATSTRRRLRTDLDATRAEVAALRTRVDELAAVTPAPAQRQEPARPGEEYVITTLATVPATPSTPPPTSEPAAVSGSEFLSVAVGESLVRMVCLAHGVRRAVSAESRNRIRFEMRREVKRSRKQRRRDVRAAQQHLRTHPVDLAEDAA